MRIMIFRTFAHTKIWEGMESYCHYSGNMLNTIHSWEPNITDISLGDVQYGLGIYESKYFKYITKNGKSAYSDSKEENHPSLLALQPTPSNPENFMEYVNGYLRCYFTLDKKLDFLDRKSMIELDKELVNLNRNRNSHIKGGWDSLYFSLDYDDGKSILSKYGVEITLN